ncbi:MAG: TolC family protein [Rickettsiales bacterium]|jgi:outer membrane protein|nr:TolC family protein [Rickettsiales bacterium]
MQKFVVLFFCLFLSLPVAARDLSLNDASNMIIAASNDIKKADANIQRANAGISAANANRWAKIDGNASYMNLINVKNPFSSDGIELPPEFGGLIAQITGTNPNIVIPDNLMMAGVNITQPIYTFGKIGNAVDALHSALEMSKSGRELIEREVRSAAENLYWTAKFADGAIGIAQKSLNDAISARAKLTTAGRAPRANLVQTEADIAQKEIALADAKFNYKTAMDTLKIMADIPLNEKLVLTDNFPKTFAKTKSGEIITNPEWDILSAQAKMYEQNAATARAGRYPTLAATGSYNYILTNDDWQMWNGKNVQSAVVGVALSVPIFDGGLASANATMAAANANAAREDLAKSKKIKSLEYKNATEKYNHLMENLSRLGAARDLAARAYGYSRDRFAAGQTSAVELAQTSAALYQMDMAVLNAKYNLMQTMSEIKKLGGI